DLLSALALLGERSAVGTIYVLADIRKLALQAEVIVLARVDRTEARWNGHRIVTDAFVSVDEAIKGKVGPTLQVVQSGGKVGEIAMRVSGVVQFHAGDRAILFLSSAGQHFRVLGLEQGKVDV